MRRSIPPAQPPRRLRTRGAGLVLAACGVRALAPPSAFALAPSPERQQPAAPALAGAAGLAEATARPQATPGWQQPCPGLPRAGAGARGAAAAACGAAAAALAAPAVLRRAAASGRAAAWQLRRLAGRATVARGAAEKAVATAEPAAEQGEPEDEPFFEEVAGDDPLVLDLEKRLQEQNGNKDLTLDMVLNPGTIVNTEREVILLKAELKATPEEETEKIKELEDKIEQKQMKIVNEMRQVMTDSLKLEFLLQAALSVPFFWALCYDAWPAYPDLAWLTLTPEDTKSIAKIFALWGVWLVTVPALRARKPGGPYGMGYEEKRALDISFLVLPLVCIGAPFFTKEPGVVFWASLAVLGGLYAWSFNTPLVAESAPRRGAGQDLDLPEPVAWVLKALDFGTGSERGERSEDTEWQGQLDSYEQAAEELLKAKKEREAKKAAEAPKKPAA